EHKETFPYKLRKWDNFRKNLRTLRSRKHTKSPSQSSGFKMGFQANLKNVMVVAKKSHTLASASLVQVPEPDSQTPEPPIFSGANLPVSLTPFNDRTAQMRHSGDTLSVSISPELNAQLRECELHVE
uniref:Uncharacterized protein n=1 Tax=Corvus moneduloides TaxID=1196302 RepID=A0A8C3DJL8_CORMO